MIIFQIGCEKENQPPSCIITVPENGEEIPHGTQIALSVDAFDNDGIIHGVNFYVNNANIGISNSQPYTYEWHTWDYEIGNHSITATSTDDTGNSTSDEITVSLTEGVPEAEFTVFHTSICPDSSAQFYNRSINHPESWLWDFGDGGTSDLQNPSHIYRTAGTYDVSLTITNSYGTDMETKTGFITVTNPLTDFDDNVYQTVKIGSQTWMMENLKTTHYADGTPLIDGMEAADISGDYIKKYCFAYNNDENNVAVHGRLYTWAAAMNGAESSNSIPSGIQGVCPTGWHLPSDNEWKELEIYLGMPELKVHKTDWRGTNEGLMLREKGKSHWWGPLWYISGTNESGFTALPGGSRHYNGSFQSLIQIANYWSATESLPPFAWARSLAYNRREVYRYDHYKSRGYSVRCVKD